jgi:hypothetical protein
MMRMENSTKLEMNASLQLQVKDNEDSTFLEF